MKKLFALCSLCVCMGAIAQPPGGTPPGLAKKGGTPPGLAKKGGTPPGLAKKEGIGEKMPLHAGQPLETLGERPFRGPDGREYVLIKGQLYSKVGNQSAPPGVYSDGKNQVQVDPVGQVVGTIVQELLKK